VYTDMKMWEEIRRRVHRDGVSKREILRETGKRWMTLEKILAHAEPPGYRQGAPRPRPKIGPFAGRIEEIVETDKGVPKKQRHTAKRIFERLKEEGYAGGYTQGKEAVRQIRQKKREVFVPLTHRPGEAQVDFGFALVKESGTLRKVAFFVMVLPSRWPTASAGRPAYPLRELLLYSLHPLRFLGFGIKKVQVGVELVLSRPILRAQFPLRLALDFDTVKCFRFRRHIPSPTDFGCPVSCILSSDPPH
jgi:transposase